MPQSLVQNYLHIVFSTKHREPFLAAHEIREEMHRYLGGVCLNHSSPSIIVGGYVDHVHIVCRLSKSMSVELLIKELKVESSKWIKTRDASLANFHWQSGYGAFSVSPSHLKPLLPYVRNQVAHHQKESYQEEFRRLLRKYEVPYDERYVWD